MSIDVYIRFDDDRNAQFIQRVPNGKWEFGHYNNCVPALFREITVLNKTFYCIILVPHMRFMSQCTYVFECDGRIMKRGSFLLSELDEMKDFLESLIQRSFENPALTGIHL